MHASMILWLCRWTAAICECLAWIVPTLSNVGLTPCQNQQGLLALSAKQSLIAKSVMEAPGPFVPAHWSGVRLHVWLYYPRHPHLHHSGRGCGRRQQSQIRSKMISYTDTPQQLLYLIKKWVMMHCGQVKKKDCIGEMASLLDTDWKVQATFLPRVSLKAHLSDKEGSNGIRQGGTRVKCLGSIWFKCSVPEGWLSCFKKETLKGLLTTLIVVYSKHSLRNCLDRLSFVTGLS